MSTRSARLPLFVLTVGLIAAVAGCKGNNQNQDNTNPTQAQNAVATQAADESQDPAEQANLAPAVNTADEAAQQQAAPPSNENQGYDYNAPEAEEPVTYAPDPPPPLPEYDQPEAPGPDYIWTPGYWNYANTGYYWVPGAWALAPYTGALWTPGYWGFYNGRYLWHRGYWGPHIGFYGGVDYGHGYTGVGYTGGYWNNGSFMYNTAVTRVDPQRIHHTYSHRVRVVNNRRISYNGGRGGISARPLTSERVASREHHTAPLPSQTTHREQASRDRSQWASQNHGHPGKTVVAQPLNEGRHAPAAMPSNVREQIQHEHAGHPPTQASRQENRAAPTTRPQPQNRAHIQMRPAQNHPSPRSENRQVPQSPTRQANHPPARNEARPQANHSAARPENRTATRPHHNASHTKSQQEKREHPKSNDRNPQP